MARLTCLRLLKQVVSRPFSLARLSAGKSSAARIPMIAMTTNNSISVKPAVPDRTMREQHSGAERLTSANGHLRFIGGFVLVPWATLPRRSKIAFLFPFVADLLHDDNHAPAVEPLG